MDPDWLDDARYEASVREEGRLEWIRRAVELTGYEAVDATPPAIRIRYRTAGTARGTNADLAQIALGDGCDEVSLTLFERVEQGVRPDGWPLGEKLAAVTRFVEVPLDRPVGERRVIDGATGEPLEPLRLDDPVPRTRYGPYGCPRWVP